MRVLIVTPRQPGATGNHVTADRHRTGLQGHGHLVHVVEADDDTDLDGESALFRPDVVHLLHAYRSGKPWLSSPLTRTFPMVVTLTGTDIHQGLDDSVQAPVIEEVLAAACAVLTQNPLTFEALKRSEAPFIPRLHYLPPAVVLGTELFSPRTILGLPPDALLFLHPSGIRPVKANLELLLAFDALETVRPPTLAFCGPVLDASYAQRFFSALKSRPRTAYLGVVPPAAIASALREADAILNHSHSEGMSTVLMEAAVLGRPALARDIPGNAAVVRDGENGFLYRSDGELLEKARLLCEDPQLRRRLSHPRPDLYRPETETAELESIYNDVLRHCLP